MNENGFGIVCCHDGKVYKYRAKELVQREKSDFYYRQYYGAYKDEEKAQMQMWKRIKEQFEIYLEEV